MQTSNVEVNMPVFNDLPQYLLPTTRYVQARELDNKHSFHYPSNKPDILSSYQFFIPHLTIMICHQIRTR